MSSPTSPLPSATPQPSPASSPSSGLSNDILLAIIIPSICAVGCLAVFAILWLKNSKLKTERAQRHRAKAEAKARALTSAVPQAAGSMGSVYQGGFPQRATTSNAFAPFNNGLGSKAGLVGSVPRLTQQAGNGSQMMGSINNMSGQGPRPANYAPQTSYRNVAAPSSGGVPSGLYPPHQSQQSLPPPPSQQGPPTPLPQPAPQFQPFLPQPQANVYALAPPANANVPPAVPAPNVVKSAALEGYSIPYRSTTNAQQSLRYGVGEDGKPLDYTQQNVLADREKMRRTLATTLVEQESEGANRIAYLPAYLQFNASQDVRMKQKLGEGGAGNIYIGEILNDKLMSRAEKKQIAVKSFMFWEKRVKGATASESANWKIKERDEAEYIENVAQFRQEVAIHFALSNHPSIAQIYGYSEEPFALFLKLYDKDLNGFLRDRTKMVPYWKLALDVAAGLAEIHSSRFIHADVKSENILVETVMENGKKVVKACLNDFGLTYMLGTNTVAGLRKVHVMGLSLPFAAPEILRRRRERHAAAKAGRPLPDKSTELGTSQDEGIDTYACAIVFWEMFERVQSWNGLSGPDIEDNVLRGNRPAFSRGRGGVHPMCRIIERCWAQKPEDRPRMEDVEELIREAGENGEKQEFS